MGLFDFVKDAGHQVFDTDDEAADNITQHLEIRTSGLRNLEVEFDDGVATICGDSDRRQRQGRRKNNGGRS